MLELTELQLAAIEVAKNSLIDKYNGVAYPDVEDVDDEGNFMSFESGCVDWIRCTGCEVISATFESDPESGFIVEVELSLNWNDEDEDNELVFEVLVHKDEDVMYCNEDDYERL